MADRDLRRSSHHAGRARRLLTIEETVEHPGAVEETVVHDPQGRPWLVCTEDVRYERWQQPVAPAASAEETARYETQVYFTARAGIRGFPTGHGERYEAREAAVAGHLRWCLRVRRGEVYPDLTPESQL